MKRKLPADVEVAALHAAGLTYAKIADRYGCAVSAVQAAMDRSKGKAFTVHNLTRATTADRDFVSAGRQPVLHRDTGDGAGSVTLEMDGVFRRSFLQIHECRDLLREWGVV